MDRVISRDIEQWPHNVPVHFGDAADTFRTGTPGEAHENRL